MISLAYYLRVIAAIWMRPGPTGAAGEATPAIAGASQEADAATHRRQLQGDPGLTFLAAAATVVFGGSPSPLVDWATAAGEALSSVLD